jgi:regulator of protease activity HflC (stomatin/prohibitin superfamily)
MWNNIALAIWGIVALYIAAKFAKSVRIVPTQKAYIVERLGRYHTTLGPGLHLLIPFFDHVSFIQDLREVAINVPPQACFTKDNVKILVDAVMYMSIQNAESASYGINNYHFAAVQLAQTTTRSVFGTLTLDESFEERDRISRRVVQVMNEVEQAWGIKVHRYELKNVVPPESVRASMERQMGAERDRRALLERVEGSKQSQINNSEGQKQEMINRSEGEMQRRINEAQGRAEEILAVARATADSIRTVGQSLTLPGGEEAVKLQLSQNLFKKLGFLSQARNHIVLPADLTNFDSLLTAFGLDIGSQSSPLRERVPVTTAATLPPAQKAAQLSFDPLDAPAGSTQQMPALATQEPWRRDS